METPMLRLLHFNDVYNIAEGRQEPVGGAPRFITALREARVKAYDSAGSMPTLTVFSGDAFSPSPITPVTKGEEIPHVLTAANIEVACIGNHDPDLGVEVMYQRISETPCPWLLTNAKFKEIDNPDFNSHGVQLQPFHVIQRNGVRIGFMGLIPEQWIDSLACVPYDQVEYRDFVEVANETSRYLREVEECDVVIALTHMRTKDDVRLAKEADDIDLILGGHDHHVEFLMENNRWIVKSGTDFRTFSHIDLTRADNGEWHVRKPVINKVTGEIQPDYAMNRLVKKYEHLFVDDDDVPIAHSAVDLDGRFCAIRSQETALGNLITDISKLLTISLVYCPFMQAFAFSLLTHTVCSFYLVTDFMEADIGLLNGGSFRSDRIHSAGDFLEKDLTEILPYIDSMVVLDLSGRELLCGLENSVSQYPALEGRFCQVSGIHFSFDPRNQEGERIDPSSVMCRSRETGEMSRLVLDKQYHVVVKTFMAAGKDGFDVFSNRKTDDIRKSKEGEDLTNLVRRHFEHLREEASDHVARIEPRVESRITCLAPDEHLGGICGVEEEEM